MPSKEHRMNRPVLLHWAFISALAGGILVLVGGLGMPLMMAMMGPMDMMGGGPSMPSSMPWLMAAWSLMTGGVVILGGVQLRTADQRQAFAWGITVLVAGALSFLAMGGFIVGGVASVAAGVMALASASPVAPRPA